MIERADGPRESEDRVTVVAMDNGRDGWMVQIYWRQNRQNGRTSEGRLLLLS